MAAGNGYHRLAAGVKCRPGETRDDEGRPVTIDPPEIIEVNETVVACNGGGGALGHPRVFLNLETDGAIDCPYCDRRFVLKAGAAKSAGH